MQQEPWRRWACGRPLAGLALILGLGGCLSSSFATVHYSAFMCTPTQYSARVATGLENNFSVSGWKATADARILSCPVNVPPLRDGETLAGRTVQVSARVDDRHPVSAVVMELFALDADGKATAIESRVSGALRIGEGTGDGFGEGSTGLSTLRLKATLPEDVRYVYFEITLPPRTPEGESKLLGYRVVVE